MSQLVSHEEFIFRKGAIPWGLKGYCGVSTDQTGSFQKVDPEKFGHNSWRGPTRRPITTQEILIMTDQPPDRILRLNTVLDRTGLSRATLYRKIQNGTFPRQVRIATRCAGWRESAVNEWMRNPMFYQVDENR